MKQYSASKLQEAQESAQFNLFLPPLNVTFVTIPQVSILTNDACQEKVLGNETIKNSMFCAGGDGPGTNKVGKQKSFYQIYAYFYLVRVIVEGPSQ